jgi:hypothetical protein
VLAFVTPARAADAAAARGSRAAALPTVVVADFELVDLAPPGERYDVQRDHQRLRLITGEVRRLVGRAGSFKLLDRGRADESPPISFRSCRACIWDWARARGAAFVVVGSVEKQSRLILWAQMALLDAAHQSVVSDASLSMRDDTDEMWKAAADNLTKRILSGASRRSAGRAHPSYGLYDAADASGLMAPP